MHIGAKHGTFNFMQSRYGSATVLPDLRITVTVNNGDHGDVVREYDEVDHMHKAMQERHPNVIEHHWKPLRPSSMAAYVRLTSSANESPSPARCDLYHSKAVTTSAFAARRTNKRGVKIFVEP